MAKIFKVGELASVAVVKKYMTTAVDGKNINISFITNP